MTNPFEGKVRKHKRPLWYDIVDANDEHIFSVCTEEEADFLCLAINNLEPCVEALTWGLDALLGMPESVRAGAGDAAIKQIRALIERIDAESKGG